MKANKVRSISIYKTILFSLLPAFLLFGLTEFGLRLFYRPAIPFRFHGPHSSSIVEPDAELGYKLRPYFTGSAYASHVATNKMGFRGPDFEPSKTDHKRIVALGDSCTFGFGASDNNHTFPARLEALFDESGEKTEVINAGIVGYSSWQTYQLFRRDIVTLKPEVVLVYVGWNDMGNSLLPDWHPKMTQELQSAEPLPRSLYLLDALADVMGRFRPRQKIEFKVAAIAAYAENLDHIIRFAREKGIEPVVLTWPTRVTTEIDRLRSVEIIPKAGVTYDAGFDFDRRYQDALVAVAQREDVRIVDLAQAFLVNQPADLYYDEIHLSDKGNQKAAQVIFEELRTVAIAN